MGLFSWFSFRAIRFIFPVLCGLNNKLLASFQILIKLATATLGHKGNFYFFRLLCEPFFFIVHIEHLTLLQYYYIIFILLYCKCNSYFKIFACIIKIFFILPYSFICFVVNPSISILVSLSNTTSDSAQLSVINAFVPLSA